MILSPPIVWRFVPVGAVVLLADGDIPRRVIMNESIHPGRPGDSRVVLIEGRSMPPTVGGLSTVRLVALDDADAVATLRAAGLNPEIIEQSHRYPV